VKGFSPPVTSVCYPVEWCEYSAAVERLYLYDGGVLLATFDKNDNVVDLYVNGPTGRLATYFQNNTYFLYYYVNDHLGNARVLVNGTGQTQYYVYYPFGQVIEAAGTHGTEFQFTGKERDDHGHFEFDYFGARYYDARVGSFTTIDKASQFASGYIYGANNPLIGVDRDGNLFFVPALVWAAHAASGIALSAAYGGVMATVSYAVTAPLAMGSNFTWKSYGKGFGNAFRGGALNGGFAAGLSMLPSMGLRGAAAQALRSGASSVASSAIQGEKVSLGGTLANMAGDYVGSKVVGPYKARFGSTTANAMDETMRSAARGMVSSVASGAIYNLGRGRSVFSDFGERARAGFFGGMGSGIATNLMHGAPFVLSKEAGEDVDVSVENMKTTLGNFSATTRKGGVFSWFVPRSFYAFGQVTLDEVDITDPKKRCDIIQHEFYHAYQEIKYGTALMTGRAWNELLYYGDGDNYGTPGTIEYEAAQHQGIY